MGEADRSPEVAQLDADQLRQRRCVGLVLRLCGWRLALALLILDALV